jgi:mannose-6-phosphate isomerase-like protein (cupin superfamily)
VSTPAPLVLLNRHTGERLELTRFEASSGPWLEIRGRLPPRSEGPPLHIHMRENEGGRVIAGSIHATLGDRTLQGGPGEALTLPKGVAHRWWNAGSEELIFEGYAHPVVDVDRLLHALFEVVNAGPPDRPPLFYMAHVLHRHRHTQLALVMPPLVQQLLFPVVIAVGHLLGRYRGDDWPGCPARCLGARAGGPREVPSLS